MQKAPHTVPSPTPPAPASPWGCWGVGGSEHTVKLPDCTCSVGSSGTHGWEALCHCARH